MYKLIGLSKPEFGKVNIEVDDATMNMYNYMIGYELSGLGKVLQVRNDLFAHT